jgi:hypothetical protein
MQGTVSFSQGQLPCLLWRKHFSPLTLSFPVVDEKAAREKENSEEEKKEKETEEQKGLHRLPANSKTQVQVSMRVSKPRKRLNLKLIPTAA